MHLEVPLTKAVHSIVLTWKFENSPWSGVKVGICVHIRSSGMAGRIGVVIDQEAKSFKLLLYRSFPLVSSVS